MYIFNNWCVQHQDRAGIGIIAKDLCIKFYLRSYIAIYLLTSCISDLKIQIRNVIIATGQVHTKQ